VGVAAAILLALGIPLAIAVHSSILDSEVVELQASAARALVEIDVPLDRVQLQTVVNDTDAPEPFSVYDQNGALLFGNGPVTPDAATLNALNGVTTSSTDGHIVVATPITDRVSEQVIGVLRLTEPLSEANRRSNVAWAIMGGAGLVALGVGWLIARRLARTLSRPVTELANAAARRDGAASGGGVATFRHIPPSGVAEIDTLASALADSSDRVNESLARERRFSADVSHQLRTPLTGLRLHLEAGRDGNTEAFDAAFDDLDRVEQTVKHLLAFARDAMPAVSSVRIDEALQAAARRWTDRVAAAHRRLVVSNDAPLTVKGSSASVDQILDVLIENALQHGAGSITVTSRELAGGGAIDVGDEGASITSGDEQRVFARGEGHGTGIGLALARSMAEAEGGRLLLVHRKPTTFSLILLEPEPSSTDDLQSDERQPTAAR